jgi:predicted kinase
VHVIEVVVIAGPPGVGKSSTAREVSNQLRRARVAHAVIDTEALGVVYPPPANERELTERNVAAVTESFREHGARRLVIAGTHLTRRDDLEWVRRATAGERFTLIQLAASEATLRARLRHREMGSGPDGGPDGALREVPAPPRDLSPEVRLFETERSSLEETAAHIIAVAGWA